MRKLLIILAILALPSAALAQHRGWHGGGHYGGWGGGGNIVGGILGGLVGGAIVGGLSRPYYERPYYGGNSYDAYCMQRFRSYDPFSRSYMGYDGYRHPCP